MQKQVTVDDYLARIKKRHPKLKISRKAAPMKQQNLSKGTGKNIKRNIKSITISSADMRVLIKAAREDGEAIHECIAGIAQKYDMSKDYTGEMALYMDWKKSVKVNLKLKIKKATPSFSWEIIK